MLWLDAKDPNGTGTPPSSTSTLSTWIDKSGNGNNGTAVGSPQWTSGTNPYVNINSGQYYTTNYTATSTTETAFIVFNFQGGTFFDPIGASATGGRYTFYSPSISNLQIGLSGYSASFSSASNSLMNALGTIVLAEYSFSPTANSMYASGNTLTLSPNNTLSPSSSTSSITQIGTNGPSNANNGFIYEIMIFNTVLSISDRQKVEGYLAWKWGLNSKLPTTHPYYSTSISMSGGGSNTLALGNTIVPKIIYEKKNKNKKPSYNPTETFMSGGGVILNPASYALDQ